MPGEFGEKIMKLSEVPGSRRLTRRQARAALPEELRATFDKICDETIAWSQYFYGTTLVSYSILMKMVEDGWTKNRK